MLYPGRKYTKHENTSVIAQNPWERAGVQAAGQAGNIAGALGGFWKDKNLGYGVSMKTQGEAAVTGGLEMAGSGFAMGNAILPGIGGAIGAGAGALIGAGMGLMGNKKAQKDAQWKVRQMHQQQVQQQQQQSAMMYNGMGQQNSLYAEKGAKLSILPGRTHDCGCGCHGNGGCGDKKLAGGGETPKVAKPGHVQQPHSAAVAPMRKPMMVTGLNDIRDEQTRKYLQDRQMFHGSPNFVQEEGRLLAQEHIQNGNPKIRSSMESIMGRLANGRANYNPLNNTMYLGNDQANYHAELAHAQQRKNYGTFGFLSKGVQSYLKSPFITPQGQYRQYDIKGTLEHEAHSVIQPRLTQQADSNYIKATKRREKGGIIPAFVWGGEIGPIGGKPKPATTARRYGEAWNVAPSGQMRPLEDGRQVSLETKGFAASRYLRAPNPDPRLATSRAYDVYTPNTEVQPQADPMPKVAAMPPSFQGLSREDFVANMKFNEAGYNFDNRAFDHGFSASSNVSDQMNLPAKSAAPGYNDWYQKLSKYNTSIGKMGEGQMEAQQRVNQMYQTADRNMLYDVYRETYGAKNQNQRFNVPAAAKMAQKRNGGKLFFKNGGAVILGGQRHKEGNEDHGKGNPIISAEGEKVAETEAKELMLDIDQTKEVEGLVEAYYANPNDQALLELGTTMQRIILKETKDNSGTVLKFESGGKVGKGKAQVNSPSHNLIQS